MIQCQITVPSCSDCLARTDKYKFPDRDYLTLILCTCSSYTNNYIGMQGAVEERSKVKAALFAPLPPPSPPPPRTGKHNIT